MTPYVCCDVRLSARRVDEVKWLETAEKGGDICQTLFSGRAQKNGMFARVWDLEWFLLREAHQAIVARKLQYSENVPMFT